VKIKSIFAAPFLMIVVLALMTLADLVDPASLGGVNPYLAVIIMQLIVYALPAVFFCRMRGRDYGAKLRIRFFRPSHIFLIIAALAAMISGCALINYGMRALFPEAYAGSTAVYAGAADAGIYAVLAFCVLPAVAEEFLFRGILLAEYESVSVPFAVVISSLFFGMLHLNFVRLPAYFFSGILLALVLYASRSVTAAMLLHILNNIAALWTERYAANFVQTAGERSVLLVFILVCVLLASLILFFMEAQRIYRGYGEDAVPSAHVRRRRRGEPSGALEAVSTPPFVIFVVMYILFTFVSL